MRPDPFGQAVTYRPHVQVDCFQTAKRSLHGRQAFVGAHRPRSVQRLRGDTGPQYVEPIKRSFRCDTLEIPAVGKPRLGYLKSKMLPHLEPLKCLADA